MNSRCWALGLPAFVGGCGGPQQRAHLLPQRVLRKELGAEFSMRCPTCGAGPREWCRGRRGARLKHLHPARAASWLEVVWDPRCWRWMCERHHRMLDDSRRLRVPRWHLPPELEAFAEEHGLAWWLDREYGERR
jgi:hypothetical protein